MKRSPQWYRQQSERAEREYRRVWWGRAAPPLRQSAAEKIFPHLTTGRTVEIALPKPQSAPDSVASRIFPHLPRDGSK
jgi:hypothetical protein